MGASAGALNFQPVQSEVPFGAIIRSWLPCRAYRLDDFVDSSRAYDSRYLAWETVRKARNPFFVNGTGFEGYLVGQCNSPEEALNTILSVCQGSLERIARLYRYNWEFRSRLFKVLRREHGDSKAIAEWSAQLGAILGLLRCNVYRTPAAQQFQTQTYLLTTQLPPIDYIDHGGHLDQRYMLICDNGEHFVKVRVEPGILKPSQEDAWMVAEHIGEFGHPLIREYLALQGG